jgi:hypothetical protein
LSRQARTTAWRSPPEVERAVSGDQCNASASACEGVLKPRVCRGQPLSSAAAGCNAFRALDDRTGKLVVMRRLLEAEERLPQRTPRRNG